MKVATGQFLTVLWRDTIFSLTLLFFAQKSEEIFACQLNKRNLQLALKELLRRV